MNLLTGSIIALYLSTQTFVFIKFLKRENASRGFYLMLQAMAFATSVTFFVFRIQSKYFPGLMTALVYLCVQLWFFYSIFLLCSSYAEDEFAKKILRLVFLVLTFSDTAVLMMNLFTRKVFVLTWWKNILGHSFFKIVPNVLYDVHFVYSAVLLLTSLVIVFRAFIYSPSLQKRKYTLLLTVLFLMSVFYITERALGFISVLSIIFPLGMAVVANVLAFKMPEKMISYIISRIQESTNEAIVCFDYSGHIVFANTAAKKIMTLKKIPEYVTPRYLFDYFRQDYTDEIKASSWTSILEVNSKICWYKVSYEKLFYREDVIGCYFKLKDITIAHNEFEEQEFNAYHDPLTGLYNMTGFFMEADKIIKANPYSRFVMLCSNIKDFKLINNIFGKETGDKVLVRIGEILKKQRHKNSIAARISDDKFAHLLEDEYFNEEDFNRALEDFPIILDNSVYRINFKVGIYRFRGASESAELILDKALLAAKRQQDNHSKFSYFDDSFMHRIIQEKYLLGDFDNFLASKKYSVKFKPLVNSDSRIYGAKCSADWHDEDGAFSTSFVIKTLDKTGFIYRLDSCIWEESIKALKEILENFPEFFINLHVCEKDFYYMEIQKKLSEFTERYEVPSSRINVCIPEKIVSKSFDRIKKECEALRNAGFKILIEDFGSDFSSLNMLKDLTVDLIEIDVSFFYDGTNSAKTFAILSNIAEMTRNLGIKLIFSGIDGRDTMELVSNISDVLLDGEYFSSPLSAKELEKRMS